MLVLTVVIRGDRSFRGFQNLAMRIKDTLKVLLSMREMELKASRSRQAELGNS